VHTPLGEIEGLLPRLSVCSLSCGVVDQVVSLCSHLSRSLTNRSEPIDIGIDPLEQPSILLAQISGDELGSFSCSAFLIGGIA
jgi:hypothetical protein